MSVTQENYELQRDATAAAFHSAAVKEGIRFSPEKCVGVAVLEWSTEQHLTVPWTRICTADEADAFAEALHNTSRSESGLTFVGDAIADATRLFDSAPWVADKKVIDVSGDGRENGHRTMEVDQARALAASYNIRVNGLSIDSEGDEEIHKWYREHVRTPDGFCFESVGWTSFARAIELKIREEIVDEQQHLQRRISSTG